jgi:hypothetical protein
MASNMSLYLGSAICKWLAGTAMPAAPTNCFVALYNGSPKASGTEVTATIRTAGRVGITFDTVGTNDNNVTNSAAVDFGASAGAVGNLDFVGIFDAASSGNLLFSAQLPGGPFAVTAGAPVSFNAGDLTFTIGSAA